jgi:site-specific DNA recombinase
MFEASSESKIHLAGLLGRVSTDRQAANDEGSLVTQLQRLREHLSCKSRVAGEVWEEVAVYELRAISGKDSIRSAEFERLIADMRSGRVNTVLCTALDRISRSVRDILRFFELLEECGVEFVCLKQNFDTTSPQGRFQVNMMASLAQLERETTSERTRDSMQARTERGLWNGGRLYGFDPDSDRKGYLLPNEAELVAVDYALDAYLAYGTIAAVTAALNRAGYRTKGYTSRRGVYHAGHEFSFTTVQHMLKNVAYIGEKAVREAGGIRFVDAVWPAVVDEEKFRRVQDLMALNARSKHGAATPSRHTYVLSGGLLACRCGSAMEGRSGTGRLGTKYFYYACRNKTCGLRVSAGEVEGAVLARLQQLGSDSGLLDRLVSETNLRLRRQLPSLRKRRASLLKTMSAVKGEADRLLLQLASLTDEQVRGFATDSLRALVQQRDDLERGIAEVDRELTALESASVSADAVRMALSNIGGVYECLQPYERKELVRLLLQRAEVSERRITLEIRAGLEEFPRPAATGGKSGSRSERPGWLPDPVARSVVVDRFYPGGLRRVRRAARPS